MKWNGFRYIVYLGNRTKQYHTSKIILYFQPFKNKDPCPVRKGLFIWGNTYETRYCLHSEKGT